MKNIWGKVLKWQYWMLYYFLHIFCSLFQLPDWIKIGDLTSETCHVFVNLQSRGLSGGGIVLTWPEAYTIIQSIADFILMQT